MTTTHIGLEACSSSRFSDIPWELKSGSKLHKATRLFKFAIHHNYLKTSNANVLETVASE